MALMALRDGIYVSRIFFADLEKPKGDILVFVFHNEGEENIWRLRGRVRLYVDNDVTSNSQDYKHPFEATYHGSILSVLPKMRERLGSISDMGFKTGEVQELVIDSDKASEVTEILSAQPWMHLQPDPKIAQA